jgi:hypothetical protein
VSLSGPRLPCVQILESCRITWFAKVDEAVDAVNEVNAVNEVRE